MPVKPNEPPCSLTLDEAAGMAWWNILKPAERADWLTKAGAACSVADAWAVFKRSQSHPHNHSP